ncbi:hypothetical protein H5410_000994 [Solanum commersonii]|uniref:Uncharacterized protein n=1 Tax=Solanum commersonii TaxID=4109 RepID=A0A9J6AXE2_SOLCO|nr:hypothetical protein H5410_000994 [Solanum commersonii]
MVGSGPLLVYCISDDNILNHEYEDVESEKDETVAVKTVSCKGTNMLRDEIKEYKLYEMKMDLCYHPFFFHGVFGTKENVFLENKWIF